MMELYNLERVKKVFKIFVTKQPQTFQKHYKQTRYFIQAHFSHSRSTDTFVTDPKQSKSFGTLFRNHNCSKLWWKIPIFWGNCDKILGELGGT